MKKNNVIAWLVQLISKQIPIFCLLIVSLIAAVSTGCKHVVEIRQNLSFDLDWRFYAGEITGAEKLEFKVETVYENCIRNI